MTAEPMLAERLEQSSCQFTKLWDVEEYGEIKKRLKIGLLNHLISTADCKQMREANY